MTEMIGQTIGNYRIEATLGAGGMGQVYRARHIHLDRPAALKVIRLDIAQDGGLQARFRQEARAVGALKHPNIIEVYDFDEDQGLAYLVMELVNGGSLRDRLKRRAESGEGWELARGLELIRQAADGLAYAHTRGMVHRDIKPDNMLLAETGHADELPTLKVSDFGLARLAEGSHLTGTGMAVGTPAYMSPEQYQGVDLDKRSDIYSLGVVLYEVAVGTLPFSIKTPYDGAYKHMSMPPPPPRELRPDLPEALEAIILRCLAKNPDERFGSASDLSGALRRVLGSSDAGMHTQIAPIMLPETEQSGSDPTLMRHLTPGKTPLIGPLGVQVTQPQLRVLDAQGTTLQVVELRRGGVTIGRATGNELVLDGEGVSRFHVRVGWDGQQAQVTDLGSSNGTLLGERRLAPQVAVAWPWRTALQLGPFWVRLEPATMEPQNRNTPALGWPGNFATPVSMAVSERLGLELEGDSATLTPGQPTSIRVMLANLGATVDHLTLSVSGIPEEWLREGMPSVRLNPGNQENVTLTVQPPRTPESLAQDYPVTVRARSRSNPEEGASALARWSVLPFSESELTLAPPRSHGRTQANYHVALSNTGNVLARYRLSASDAEGGLSYVFAPEQLAIEPGQSETARLTVERGGRLIGRESTHSFQVQAHGSAGAATPSASAQFIQRALLPPWVLAVLALVLLFVGGTQAWPRIFPAATATPTALTLAGSAAGPNAQQTQAAEVQQTTSAQQQMTQSALAQPNQTSQTTAFAEQTALAGATATTLQATGEAATAQAQTAASTSEAQTAGPGQATALPLTDSTTTGPQATQAAAAAAQQQTAIAATAQISQTALADRATAAAVSLQATSDTIAATETAQAIPTVVVLPTDTPTATPTDTPTPTQTETPTETPTEGLTDTPTITTTLLLTPTATPPPPSIIGQGRMQDCPDDPACWFSGSFMILVKEDRRVLVAPQALERNRYQG